MLYFKDFLKLLLVLLIHSNVEGTERPAAIAVIGAGLGGTSVSFFLKELFEDEKVDISIYEAHEIGGRLATRDIDGQKYEAGGSVIHPDNKYMAHFCKKFDLRKSKSTDMPKRFGLYDGNQIVFAESKWEIVTWVRMLWRYGLSLLTLSNQIEKMLSDFKRIYQLQDNGKSFNSVGELLNAMSPDFLEAVKMSSAEGFYKEGISNITINELIMAGLMVNYGQTLAAHKFVGGVSVAAEGGHLWAIAGGNKLVPEKLLKSSGAKLINQRINKISLDKESGQFHVSYSPSQADTTTDSAETRHETDGNVTKIYDLVIIAAPLTSDTSEIVFENFPTSFVLPGGRYHQTVCTIVKGELNYKYFGEAAGLAQIFSIKSNLIVNSVGMIYPVDSQPKKEYSNVWKVFSQEVLKEDELNELFVKLDEVEVIDWLAYPHYVSYQELGSFVLHKNLYHINSIEWAASAMEMIVIGAKNVALLAYKDWTGKSLDIEQRDEL